LDDIATRFGAQVLVLSLDLKRSDRTASGFIVTTHGGRTETDVDAVEWTREAQERGVGELLVNSIDADGTKDGFDLELISLIAVNAHVPVIASGGAGNAQDFAPAVAAGADAVLAASIFHSGDVSIADVKTDLTAHGYEVRAA
jgi:cyclase